MSGLTFDEYQTKAQETSGAYDGAHRLIGAALGLAGEAGEVADEIKKQEFHGHPRDDEGKLIDEMGDVLWYLAELCDALGCSLSLVAALNVEKLQERYGGAFSEERSLHKTVWHLRGDDA